MKLLFKNGALSQLEGAPGAQHSANVRFEFETEPLFAGYTPSLSVRYKDEEGNVLDALVPYSDGKFEVPAAVYKTSQVIMLTAAFTKGSETVTAFPYYVRVLEAADAGNILPSDEKTWQSYIDDYLDSKGQGSGGLTQDQIASAVKSYLENHPVEGDGDTTYTVSLEGNVLTITGSDGSTQTITLPSGGGTASFPEGGTVGQVLKKTSDGVAWADDETGNVSDEQIATSVDAWLDAHPEATTTVADGSITPAKTSFIPYVFRHDDDVLYEASKYRWALKNDGTKYYHSWDKNYNLIGTADRYKISAISAYINYAWTVEDPATITNANNLTVVGFGGTYNGYTNLNGTDVLSPEAHSVETEKPDGANYLLVDFGYTTPADTVFMSNSGVRGISSAVIAPESIPDNMVTEKALAPDCVSTEKLKARSVTGDKTALNTIDGDNLCVSYHVATNTRFHEDSLVLVKDNVEFYTAGIRNAVAYPNRSGLYVYKLKSGRTYRMGAIALYQSPYSDKILRCNPDDIANINKTQGFVSTVLLTADEVNFTKNKNRGYVCDISSISAFKNLDGTGYGTVYGNDGSSYSGAFFTVGEQDLYVYGCALKPNPDDDYEIVETSIGTVISEIDKDVWLMDGLTPTDYTVSSGSNSVFGTRYKKSYSGYANENSEDTFIDNVNNVSVEQSDKIREALGLKKKPLRAMVIGDSITYAASNAGLQNAWRKYISARMGMYEPSVMAVSGTGIIDGAPYDFLSHSKTSEDYRADCAGATGLMNWIIATIEGDTSTWVQSGFTKVQKRAIMKTEFDIAIVALGTNDFTNNGTLGSISTINDTSTFYGAVYTFYNFLMENLNVRNVLFVAPFPRKDINMVTKNNASTPYCLFEMAHALAEIAVIQPNMHVLDLTGAWYFNTANEEITKKAFIDGVHITGWAHHLVTMDMAREIERILAYEDTGWRNT